MSQLLMLINLSVCCGNSMIVGVVLDVRVVLYAILLLV